MRPLILSLTLAACLGAGSSAGAEPAAPAPVEDRATAAPETAFPPFLPYYYAPALEIAGTPLHLAAHDQKDNQSRYVYVSADQVISLSVESLACDGALCSTVFDKAISYFNEQATKGGGQFRAVTRTEFRVDWSTGLSDNDAFVFKLPRSLLFWTYGTRLDRSLPLDAYFERLKAFSDRQRYEEALPQGNVEMGRWGPQIRDWARDLLRDGKKAEALSVLKEDLQTSPSDYEAQMDFAENTDDRAAARASAQIVLDNAEDAALLDRAAALLGRTQPGIAGLPLLADNERGLQLILIPLPPCSVLLLEEAAQVYTKITNVAVKIARLPDKWRFGEPDRLRDEKRIRQAIIAEQGPKVDFSGWTKERYLSELLKMVASKDALAKFSMKTYVDRLEVTPGQYRADPYLDRFIDLIAKYRSNDVRTMYVGVTEANIYDDETNYVFSLFTTKRVPLASVNRGASILSYSMMMAKTLGEEYESRKRLVERLAKELVPASLKALDIPRPADPTDPYSFSNGVDRLAQKSLVLSPPVREALDTFR